MSDPGGDDAAPRAGAGVEAETVLEYLIWGAVLAFAIFAVVAAVGLYTSLVATIDVWISERYQPPARAALNFVVLCLAVAGVLATLRRL